MTDANDRVRESSCDSTNTEGRTHHCCFPFVGLFIIICGVTKGTASESAVAGICRIVHIVAYID